MWCYLLNSTLGGKVVVDSVVVVVVVATSVLPCVVGVSVAVGVEPE